MSTLPLWRDLILAESPAELQEAYPPAFDKDTPVPVSEREMTDAEMEKRDKIVKALEDKKEEFKARYGDRWEEVLNATATKMAMESKLTEAPETFTVMAIGDPTPSWKRSDYNYKPTAKVLDQMHSLEKSDIVHAAKMFRQKFPKATISVENKSGKIVKVFKPGEMIKEAASNRPIKVGDYVHAGLAVKGGAGFSGRVDKIDGNYVYVNVSKDKSVQFKDDPLTKWGDRIIKAPIKNVSLQEAASILPKAFLLKAYRQNEEDNNHTGNALLLIRLFGTPQEILLAKELMDIRDEEGYIDPDKYKNLLSKVEALHDKYYRQLMSLKEAEDNTDYETYFRAMLKKHGYASPADIPDEKKDDFFNAVDAGYAAKNEEWASQTKSMKEDKKPYVWKCMNCGNKWRSSQSGQVTDVRCSKCGASGEDDILPGRMEMDESAGLTAEEKKPYVWKCMNCGNKWRSSQSGQVKDVRCSKCGASGEDDILPGRMEVGESAGLTAIEEGSDDQEMVLSQLQSINSKSAAIHNMLQGLSLSDVPAWIQDKLSVSDHNMSAILDFYESGRQDTTEPITEAPDAMVPLRMQAAMVIAKSLGAVKGSGVAVDFKAAGSSPEALVNQAVRVWLQGSHTNEGWALGAKMLKLAKQMGIKWDENLLKGKLAPITLKKLGLTELVGGYDAGTVSTAREGQKKSQLSLQQTGERSALSQRHEREREQAKTGLDRDRLTSKHEREREALKQKHERERASLKEQDTDAQMLRQKHMQQKAALQTQQTREKVALQQRKMQAKMQQMQAKSR